MRTNERGDQGGNSGNSTAAAPGPSKLTIAGIPLNPNHWANRI